MPDAQIPCGCVCQSLPESSTLPLSTLPSPLPSVSHHQDEITNHHKSGRNPPRTHAPLRHITNHHKSARNPHAHTHAPLHHKSARNPHAHILYTHRCNTSQERAQPPCAHMHCCDTHHASQERAQPPRKRPVFSSRRSRSGRAGVLYPVQGSQKTVQKHRRAWPRHAHAAHRRWHPQCRRHHPCCLPSCRQ